MDCPSTNIDRRRGFTLVESLIASVVLAVAVVGIAGTLAASYQQAKDQVSISESTSLARQLMEEISAKPFAVAAGDTNFPGYSAANTGRTNYDDVSDYHGYTDVSTSLRTLGGQTYAVGTAGPYTRSVTVTTNGAVPSGHTAAADDFRLITVTVTRPSGPPAVIAKIFTRATMAQ